MRPFALLLAALALAGCAAPIQATRNVPQPQTLSEVNALLDGRTVSVQLVSGDVITGARRVSVDTAAVRLKRPGRPPAAWTVLPVGDVERITYVRNRGTLAGAGVGAASGVVPLVIRARMRPSGNAVIDQLMQHFLLLSSAPTALLGAAVGGWFGQAVSPGGVVTLYEAPVDQYTGARP